MRIEIISVMTFNDEGKIASMKAYWTPENVTQLSVTSAWLVTLSVTAHGRNH